MIKPMMPLSPGSERSADAAAPDPQPTLLGLVALRRMIGAYPERHPMIAERLQAVDDAVQNLLQHVGPAEIDILRGEVYLNGQACLIDPASTGQALGELRELGIESIHLSPGVTATELLALAGFLWERRGATHTESVNMQLAARGIRHISLGRLVPVDTRWQSRQWSDRPAATDPDYAASISQAENLFDTVSRGADLKATAVSDLVQLLMCKVAHSTSALSLILAVKQYENLTYCHSVNVAMLSLLLGREIGLRDETLTVLLEAALLHDIGKTQVPVEVLMKPGALDPQERRQMEAHTTVGANILMHVPGLHPLSALVALEHHRGVTGKGYPDLGPGAVPHPLSQIVSLADIYEAVTGARSYRAPIPPERACLMLARMGGDQLNSSLVKAFVNAVTFFPVGSVVRTSHDCIGIVIRTTPGDPLHPVIVPVDTAYRRDGEALDTSLRAGDGTYRCHILETLSPPDGVNVGTFLADAA